MKWDMPIGPIPTKDPALPTLVIGTANPDLAVILENSANVGQHLLWIDRMFQHVGKHDHVVEIGWLKFLEKTCVNDETIFARNVGGVVFSHALEARGPDQRTNPGAIARYGKVPILGALPYILNDIELPEITERFLLLEDIFRLIHIHPPAL